MVRIYTEAGEFSLPEDFSIEIEISNPMLSSDGSASIPFTVPATPGNLVAAGRPDLLSRMYSFRNGVECIVQYGAFQIQGNLMISSCTADEIGGVISFCQSKAYSSDKDRSLKNILAEMTYNFGQTNLETCVGLINDSMTTKETQQWFDRHELVALPVRCKIAEGIEIVLNELEDTSDEYGESFGSLVYKARSYKSGDLTLNVPDGYGVAVFPYLCYIIRAILSALGYKVKHNDFDSKPYEDLVLLHPCADLICHGGNVYLRDFVPDITFGEFLTWLEDKFGAYVNVDGDTAGVYIMDEVLDEGPAVDVTGYIQEDEAFEIPDAAAVRLSADTSIDGAAPVAATYTELMNKFRKYTKVDTDMGIGKTDGLYYAEATGDFWQVTNGTRVRLGTDAFTVSGCFYSESEKEKKPSDKALRHDYHYHYKPSPVIPFIGDAVHYHTAIQGQEEKQEHPLMVCWAYYDKYWMGTATGWTGHADRYPSLSPHGLFAKFWRKYNTLLLNGAPEVSVTLNLPVKVLQDLNVCRPVLYRGVRALVKSLKYSISDHGIAFGEAKLWILPEIENPTDCQPITM